MADIFSPSVAASRFGLAESDLGPLRSDPRAWLLSQIGPADPPAGPMPAAEQLAADQRRLRQERKAAQRQRDQREPSSMAQRASEPADGYVDLMRSDQRERLRSALDTRRPFAERLAWFWTNHFTVSTARAAARGLVGLFEREAIRPHLAGSFEQMLRASTTHPTMLVYLDNHRSVGPNSPNVLRHSGRPSTKASNKRAEGLNENLARELLELHTLGVARGPDSAYAQADVTALAAVLTGWRPPDDRQRGPTGQRFHAQWHEPGRKQVLGRSLPEGPGALDEVLHLLAGHPATARHVCTRMARYFVSDDPAPSLVARLVDTWQRSQGDLRRVTEALVTAPESWSPSRAKLRTPEDFAVASWRVLGLGSEALRQRHDAGIQAMGQRIQAAPSPAGWPDRADEWLGPEALWSRVEWAQALAGRLGARVDARQLARDALGEGLSDATARQIQQAADAEQALTLLLMSPEIQRR